MTKRVLQTILFAGAFCLGLSFMGVLEAKVTCTGDACTLLPDTIQSQLNSIDQAFQSQYTNEVLKTMSEAAVISNINSSLMGPGLVNRFQVGVGVSVAGQQKENTSVTFQNLSFQNLPNVGASISPNIVAAVNLGWLRGAGPSDTEPELKTLLHRFNLYLHGFQFNFAENNVQRAVESVDKNLNLAGDISNFGFTLRYHLIENISDGYGFFEFSGISFGLGLHYQKQSIDLRYNDNKTQSLSLGPALGTWGGETRFQYNSTVTSIPLDLRTGFRLFYFVTLFAGAGTSLNFGSTNLQVSRQGPLTLALDESLAQATLPASVVALIPASAYGTTKTGNLAIDFSGKAQIPNSVNFVLAGIELNAFITKITVEAMFAQRVQSVMVGAKFSF